jgi:hypothetical protein
MLFRFGAGFATSVAGRKVQDTSKEFEFEI